MAFARFGSRRPQSGAIGDINVTPLVDVMLVLLVIFIITAPLMDQALRLALPTATTTAAPAAEPPSVLEVDGHGGLVWNGQRVDALTLSAAAQQLAQSTPQAEVLLRVDRATPYGEVAQLMARLQAAGLTRLAWAVQAQPTH